MLKTPDLGSLDSGTPVFFRRLQVGEVASYALDPDGELLTVKVFVRAPYDQYVNPNTRFWHASGVDVSRSRRAGLKVQTQSVLSILIGGDCVRGTDATLLLLPPAEGPERLHAVQRPHHGVQAGSRKIRRPTSSVFNESSCAG